MSLCIEGHDLGVPPELVSTTTRPSTSTRCGPEHLPELLGADPDDDLREVLGTNGTDGASGELEKKLREAPFEVEFYLR